MAGPIYQTNSHSGGEWNTAFPHSQVNFEQGNFYIKRLAIAVDNYANRPKNKPDDVTPSRVSFLTCRGEKYVQYYTLINSGHYLCARPLNAKNPYLDGGHQCKVQTLLFSGPMLKIDYPVSHKPLASLFPQVCPLFNPTCPHMWHNLPKEKQHWYIRHLIHTIQ
jgi:hypothetical protein